MSTTTTFVQPDRPFSMPLARAASPVPCSVLARKLAAVRGLDLFASACEADQLRLAELSLLRRFDRGRTILRSTSTDDCVVLIEGRAKTTMPRGIGCGEFVLGILDAGMIVSTGCWAQHRQPELGETIAIEPSTALFVPRRAVESLMSRNARVGLQFLAAFSTKLRRVVELAAQNSCLEVGDRLYAKLIELAATRGRTEAGGFRIDHGLYQSELAAGIGASREAVNRQLAQWRDEGFLEAGRRYVLIKDPKGLSMAVSPAVRATGLLDS